MEEVVDTVVDVVGGGVDVVGGVEEVVGGAEDEVVCREVDEVVVVGGVVDVVEELFCLAPSAFHDLPKMPKSNQAA